MVVGGRVVEGRRVVVGGRVVGGRPFVDGGVNVNTDEIGVVGGPGGPRIPSAIG